MSRGWAVEASRRRPQGGQGEMTPFKLQLSGRVIAVSAGLLTLLALLGWRRAMQGAAVPRSESRRGRSSLGRDASPRPTSVVADSTGVDKATAAVKTSEVAGADELLLPVGAGGAARRAAPLRIVGRRALGA